MNRPRLILLGILGVAVAFSQACSWRGHTRNVASVPSAGRVRQPASPALSSYIRTMLRVSQENTVAAEEALRKLYERRPELASLAETVATGNADPESRKRLASAYLEEGLRSYAFQLYREVREQVSDDASVELAIGQIWYEWGDDSLALEYAERATVLDPQSAGALELLGRIYLRRNELDRALSALLSATKIEPGNGSLLANAGYVYMIRGDLKQAKRHLQLALAVNDSLAEAHNNLGVVLARLGERDDAFSHFLATGSRAAAFNNLGVVYLSQNKWEEARSAFSQALAENPDYGKARSNLTEAESHIRPPAIIWLRPVAPQPTRNP
jgi:tetratricopeptide (TPR) repeat protein